MDDTEGEIETIATDIAVEANNTVEMKDCGIEWRGVGGKEEVVAQEGVDENSMGELSLSSARKEVNALALKPP